MPRSSPINLTARIRWDGRAPAASNVLRQWVLKHCYEESIHPLGYGCTHADTQQPQKKYDDAAFPMRLPHGIGREGDWSLLKTLMFTWPQASPRRKMA